MIQANELRIGNWVMLADKGFYQIDCGHDIDEIDSFPKEDAYSCPIPITEQWLIDLGFKIHRTEDTYNTFALDGINVNDGVVYLVGFGFLNHIKYIHQLQNLYFAMTSKELTKK